MAHTIKHNTDFALGFDARIARVRGMLKCSIDTIIRAVGFMWAEIEYRDEKTHLGRLSMN